MDLDVEPAVRENYSTATAWVMVLLGICGFTGLVFKGYMFLTGHPTQSFWVEFPILFSMVLSMLLGILFGILIYYFHTYYKYELGYSEKYSQTVPSNAVYKFPPREVFKKLILRKDDTLDIEWFLQKAINADMAYFHVPDPRYPDFLYHEVRKFGAVDLDFYGSLLYTRYVQGNGWQIVFSHDPRIQTCFNGQGYYFLNSKFIVYGDLEQFENDLVLMRLSL